MKSQKKLELKKETIEILSQNSVRRIQGGCSKGEITVKKPTDGTCNNCFPTITCEPSVDVCPTKDAKCKSDMQCSEFACASATVCGDTTQAIDCRHVGA